MGGSARHRRAVLERACSSPSPNSLLATGRRRVASQAHQTAVASSAVWFIGPYSRRLLRSFALGPLSPSAAVSVAPPKDVIT